MYNNQTHPILAQVPLTVSPFITLPTATTLSYNYKSMPSTLPASSIGVPAAVGDESAEASKPKYVVSPSGHAAHPDDIVASCRALHAHVTEMQESAERELREWEERIQARELAEKRRVAPGWLDSEARLLEPERKMAAPAEERVPETAMQYSAMDISGASEMAANHEESELDRAFRGMGLK